MQTFVPLPDYEQSAAALDRARLGKQRVEALQILHALDPDHIARGWRNHPAVRAWKGYEGALAQYSLACVQEWTRRGYKDILCGPQLRAYAQRFADPTPPTWWGDNRVHQSHRSKLIQKMPEHYKMLWPDTPDNLDYFWPV